MEKIVFIQEIKQLDSTHFSILWTDGVATKYKLFDIQKNCPCALCRDEQTGDSRIDQTNLDPEVEAYRIWSVGRYAIQIAFTSGCSQGMYSFPFLRSLAKGVELSEKQMV